MGSLQARLAAGRLEACTLVALLGAATLLFTRNRDARVDFDEGVYLVSLEALRAGEELGIDVWASQPPGFYALLQLIGFAFGDSVTDARLGFALLATVGCLAAYTLGRAVSGRPAALAAALLLLVEPVWATWAPRVMADVPAVILALVALACAAHVLRGSSPGLLAVLSGVAFTAAVSIKFYAVTVLLPLAAMAAWNRVPRRVVAAFTVGGLGVALALAGIHLRALPELWESSVRFHAEARDALLPPRSLGQRLDTVISLAGVLTLAGAALAIPVLRNKRLGPAWPLWLWAVGSAGFLAWHRPIWWHHVVLFSAPVAVAAGVTLGELYGRWVFGRGRGLAWVGAALVVAVAFQVVRLAPLDRSDAFESEWAASVLRARTDVEDFVAADQPAVAVDAGRRIPGPLVDPSYVRIASGFLTTSAVLETLRRYDVHAVLVGRAFAELPGLVQALHVLYPLRLTRGETSIFLR